MNVKASPVRMEAGVRMAGLPTPVTVLKQNQMSFLGEEITATLNSMAAWTINARTGPPAAHGWRVEYTVTHACALTVFMMSIAPQEQHSLSPPLDSFISRLF